MSSTYWDIGRRIVEFEQGGAKRAEYGKELLERLSRDLTARFGRGFARPSLVRARQFYLAFPSAKIRSTLSNELGHANQIRSMQLNNSTARQLGKDGPHQSELETLHLLASHFPLPWSHYVLLISRSRSLEAMDFYHTEALRGGWSVRQLQRQFDTRFYERTALSRNKAGMLAKGGKARSEDAVTSDEVVRDPLVLEFLNLKDEYSERDLEEALIRHLESFLLELGSDWTFVGRQRRLRLDDTWYRIDLLFFHRTLHCLVILDLKLEALTPADIGQMHLYCNYAKAHWTHPEENPPMGIILCSQRGESLARYALEGLPNPTLVREYRTNLPDEKLLADELAKTRRLLERRTGTRGDSIPKT